MIISKNVTGLKICHERLLFCAYKDPRPIDLIPDFIPVLGYLDDLILVPFGIALAIRLIPQTVLEEHKEKAEQMTLQQKPRNRITGIMFILAWLIFAYWIGLILYRNLPFWR